MADFIVLRTKLNPPRLPRHALARPRVHALLRQALDYRVTLVHASTGYGKSTALAGLADAGEGLIWYGASESDVDPQQFLAHLITAFRLALPNLPDTPLALLQEVGGVKRAADALLNSLNDAIALPALLVIDDYHHAASNDVNALIDHLFSFLPPDLHVIVSTRYAPQWEHWVTWRARGEVAEIKREALAFTCDEIEQLFRIKYGLALSAHEIELLADKTEGWPIALQLVWQELRSRPNADVATLFSRHAHLESAGRSGSGSPEGSLDTLFAYLAQNVLAQQPQEIQDLLLQTSVLREFGLAACQAVTDGVDCSAMFDYLAERDLFLIALGEGQYRYHYLFHDLIRQQARRLDAAGTMARHRRAAEYYRHIENYDEAVYHLVQAGALEETATLIQEIGENMLRAGRLDTLAGWLDAIPPDTVAARPLLMFYLGDLARLRSRFDDALDWYAQSERAWRATGNLQGVSRALRGQALVYLDTVRPSRAESLLEESLRLNDGLDDRVARARLLELLAENKLNMGKAEEAEQLRIQARTLREEGPSEDALSVRVKLRTGRLDQAREILETWAREERGQLHPPRAHRETLLILSLIHSLQGDAANALSTANEALRLAAQLHSPFVSAVGQMRLGHAYQICGELQKAQRCYDQAMALGDQLAVQRTRAEARWGMTRAHGLGGDLESARQDAAEGIAIGRGAGDAWIVALVQTALGASLVQARRDREAVTPLGDALDAFRSCGDNFGAAAVRLWLALAHWHLGQRERALTHFEEALAFARAQHHDYLLTHRTLLGWRDPRVGVPLLLEARQRGRESSYVAHLLGVMGLTQVSVHPGYQLRVQTLGPFRVWRGEEEVAPREWQRRKARELLELFVTFRNRRLEREELYELLWREQTPDAAARDFKVALNALNKVLEPGRLLEDSPAYIAREESAYGLRAGADVWIDADEFADLVAAGDKTGELDLYRRALALYQEDYILSDARYDDWASAERERLLALYLRAADRLAAGLVARGQDDESITWCERILARDRCWEHAYRLMMQVHARRGDRAQAGRVFERCARVLREDLDMEPSAETVQVFKQICGE